MIALPLLAFYICNRMSPSEEEMQAHRDKAIYDAVERHKKTLKGTNENVHRYPEDW